MAIKAGCVFALLFVTSSGHAATSLDGNGALALAALAGLHSPQISSRDRRALSSMINGHLTFQSSNTITVAAESIVCRAGDIDISEHDCTLKFGAAARTLRGREAHEMFATLIESGVESDGAAGSVYEAVSHLTCTLVVRDIKSRGGGGATCSYDPGP